MAIGGQCAMNVCCEDFVANEHELCSVHYILLTEPTQHRDNRVIVCRSNSEEHK